jgi:hypothetical protein
METTKVWVVTKFFTVPNYQDAKSTQVVVVCSTKALAITAAIDEIRKILDAFDKACYSGSESDLEWEYLQPIIYNKLYNRLLYDCGMFSNVSVKISEHNYL